jgi:hypothetical protein
MASYLQTPVLGILLAMVMAFVLRHGRVIRLLSVLCLLGALFLLVVMSVFALDVLELHDMTPAERLPSFRAGALLAELKHLSAFVVLTLLGVGGRRSGAAGAEKERSARSSETTAEALKAQQKE